MLVLACLLSIMAACVIYLRSPNQRWLAQPLSQPWRIAAWLLSLAGLVAWSIANGGIAGPFAWLTSLMLAWVVLPYLALLRQTHTEASR